MTLRVPMDRTAVVMMSAVGDSVHVLPVLTALKRAKPDMRVTWILQPGPASLMRGHPDVDEIIPFHYGTGLSAYTNVRRELARREFDLVLALQVSLKAGIVASFTRAPVKLGFDRARARDMNWLFTTHKIPAGPRRHVQDQYFEFLAYLGVPHAPVTWNLGPWDHEREAQRAFVAKVGRPYAAIVCGTSDADRDWMPERWAAVCDALHRDYGLQPVLVGGPTERERATAAAIVAQARVSKPLIARRCEVGTAITTSSPALRWTCARTPTTCGSRRMASSACCARRRPTTCLPRGWPAGAGCARATASGCAATPWWTT